MHAQPHHLTMRVGTMIILSCTWRTNPNELRNFFEYPKGNKLTLNEG